MLSILDLALQAKNARGLTYEEIAAEAGVPGKTPADNVGVTFKRRHRLHVKLADWALRNTVFAGEAVTRALVHLEAAGLNPAQLAGVRTLLDSYGFPAQTSAPAEKLPPGRVIRVDKDLGLKLIEPPPKPGETSSEEGVASKVQEDKPDYSNQDAAAWVRGLSVKHGKRSNVDLGQAQEARPVQLPRFDERAAADGLHGSTHLPGVPLVHETEASDLKFDRKNHYLLKVSGNSMEPEIREGDSIVVQRMELYMPAYDDQAAPADPAAWKALDNKVVVAVLDEGLDAVVKRLSVIKRKDTGFKVLLLSDNRRVKPIEIDKTNSIRVIGRVVGSFHAL